MDGLDFVLEFDDLDFEILNFFFVLFEVVFELFVFFSFDFEVLFEDQNFRGLFGLLFESDKFFVHLVALVDDFVELGLEDVEIVEIA